ncbi:hypothetical protein GCM10022225_51400 [Plantactinospora mayteni]|uniref:CopG family transcriptional regulator n=1 Tax=Plantactinospora mayteni TaxID=566021 RepID=A0ABQ4EZ51_9ACTN|nr:hypothetical protein [Plantactinospora mayteni]GIG99943.1 hypothetical protein Pma05_65160 [Plantactinospora mayteni]
MQSQAPSVDGQHHERQECRGSIDAVTVSISITWDADLSAELDSAVGGGNRSAVVAEAMRVPGP